MSKRISLTLSPQVVQRLLGKRPGWSLRGATIQSAQPTIEEVRARASAARGFAEAAGPHVDGLHQARLTPQRRCLLGAGFFSCAGAFIAALIGDLRRRPAVYPDLAADVEFLQARQQEAEAWDHLKHLAAYLYDLASDNGLEAQADALSLAQEIVKRLERECQAARPDARPAALRRLIGIEGARIVLYTHRRSMVRASAKRHPQHKAAPTRHQQIARQRQDEQARADLYTIFMQALKRHAGPSDS